MKKWLAPLTLSLLSIALAGCSHPQPVYYEPPPPPPAEFREIARQGFHDGFEAARRDTASGRPLVVERHPRFRKPPVPPPAWEEYRQGFRRGYGAFLNRPPR
jgi:hypothetical protein